MSTNKEEINEMQPGISRRKFLKDAGLIVGGATVGSLALVNACGDKSTTTVTAYKYVCSIDNQEFSTLEELRAHSASAHGGMTTAGMTQLIVNGKSVWREIKANWSLAYVLREKLGLTGTKRGCDHGDCGVCTVIMDGRPALSCLVLAVEAEGKSITTVEGLVQGGDLDPLQQSFINHDALQCGFCVPGQIMTAKALLAFKSNPTVDEIKEFMAGTLCRCGAHPSMVKAVQAVAK